MRDDISTSLDSFIEPARAGRRRTHQAQVSWGSRVVTVGGDAPVRVQSMTNTDTVDAIGTDQVSPKVWRSSSMTSCIDLNWRLFHSSRYSAYSAWVRPRRAS